MNSKIKIIGVSKEFVTSTHRVLALDNISFDVNEKEFCVIVGPSGCGKSTLLYMIAGFEKPTKGKILLDGSPIIGPGPDRGLVFQEAVLYPWRTVLENVMFGLEIAGVDKEECKRRALKYIELVGLKGFENVYPHTLSGGMKQRVSIAMSLAYDPEVLLMDEPFGALDAQTRKIMQQELTRIWSEAKKTVIFVTHSVLEAIYLADKIVVMTARPGKVKKIFHVNLPRPRDYKDDAFLRIRRKILNLLEIEVLRSYRESFKMRT